jgi:four helix bundle protein
MTKYTDLKVWQRSHGLVLKIYPLAAVLPVEERFALAAQLRRAVVSVPTNIAEGSKRRSVQDYAHFLNMAEGSLAEVDYLLLVTRDLGYLEEAAVQPLRSEADEIAAMLHTLRTFDALENRQGCARQKWTRPGMSGSSRLTGGGCRSSCWIPVERARSGTGEVRAGLRQRGARGSVDT